MSYKQRYTLFSILKYLVIFSFGFSVVFLAFMDGYDTGEGEIDTFRFALQLFTLRYDATGIELYYQVGTIISAVNFVLMLVFYPCTDNDSYNYNGKLKLVNLLGVISVPALWRFFTSLWAFDNIDILRYYLKTSPDFTELLCMFLTLVPAIACGIMSVMGIAYKNPENNTPKSAFQVKRNSFDYFFIINVILMSVCFLFGYFCANSVDTLTAILFQAVFYIFEFEMYMLPKLKFLVYLAMIVKIVDLVILYKYYRKSDLLDYKLIYRVLNVISVILTPFTLIYMLNNFAYDAVDFYDGYAKFSPVTLVVVVIFAVLFVATSVVVDVYGVNAPVHKTNSLVKPKKWISATLCSLLAVVSFLFTVSFYLPMSADEFVYGEDFEQMIYEENIDEIREILDSHFKYALRKDAEKRGITDTTPDREYMIESIRTEAFCVYIDYIVRSDTGREYVFEFRGRRIWFGYYDWTMNSSFYDVLGIEI